MSGKTLEKKYPLKTFDESNYKKNPFLCASSLRNNCNEEESPWQPKDNDEQEDDGFIDIEFFYISFGICYRPVCFCVSKTFLKKFEIFLFFY